MKLVYEYDKVKALKEGDIVKNDINQEGIVTKISLRRGSGYFVTVNFSGTIVIFDFLIK